MKKMYCLMTVVLTAVMVLAIGFSAWAQTAPPVSVTGNNGANVIYPFGNNNTGGGGVIDLTNSYTINGAQPDGLAKLNGAITGNFNSTPTQVTLSELTKADGVVKGIKGDNGTFSILGSTAGAGWGDIIVNVANDYVQGGGDSTSTFSVNKTVNHIPSTLQALGLNNITIDLTRNTDGLGTTGRVVDVGKAKVINGPADPTATNVQTNAYIGASTNYQDPASGTAANVWNAGSGIANVFGPSASATTILTEKTNVTPLNNGVQISDQVRTTIITNTGAQNQGGDGYGGHKPGGGCK